MSPDSQRVPLRARLLNGVDHLQLTLTKDQIEALLEYQGLLSKWNKAYNLTAIRDDLEMVDRHLLDSLSIVPFVRGKRILDVGTGPGLPGMVLAIVMPERNFTLVDSNGKKTRFLVQAKAALGLDNVEVVHGRIEALEASELYDSITSRAFSSLEQMLDLSAPLCGEDGVFLAMKGLHPDEELSQVKKPFIVEACHQLSVPGTEAERHLVIIRKSNDSDPV